MVWIAWWWAVRVHKLHAWRAPAVSVALHATVALEVYDFPPLAGLLDAHALWHASTAPLAYFFWQSFVRMELEWLHTRSGRKVG